MSVGFQWAFEELSKVFESFKIFSTGEFSFFKEAIEFMSQELTSGWRSVVPAFGTNINRICAVIKAKTTGIAPIILKETEQLILLSLSLSLSLSKIYDSIKSTKATWCSFTNKTNLLKDIFNSVKWQTSNVYTVRSSAGWRLTKSTTFACKTLWFCTE